MQTKPQRQRAAIYARYSTDLQNELSIEHQVRMCRNLADREKLEVVETYSDKAKSGYASVESKAGVARLMVDAKARRFDVLIVEAYDRLVRDHSDAILLFQQLSFAGVTVLTVNEGKASELMVGLRALVNSMAGQDTAFRVRRHHSGEAAKGRVMGNLTYGYRLVPGKPGEREIDPAKAKIIKRIFEEYADERSPRDIAKDLTRDGVPTPNGAPAWRHQALRGASRGGGIGLLVNPIYKGVLVWNRGRNARNPFNQKKKTQRLAPAEDIVTAKVPHLRIVSDALWNRAQAVRETRSVKQFGTKGWVSRRPMISRGEWPLAGLLRCGVCNGPMRIAQSGPRVACAAAHMYETCKHGRSYDLARVQTLVIDAARKVLADPERHKKLMAKLHAESIAQQKSNRASTNTVQKRLDEVQRHIKRMLAVALDANGTDDDTAREIMKALKPYERERATLKEQLRIVQGSKNVVTLLPNVLGEYNKTLAGLSKSMGSADEVESRRALRTFLGWAVIHPTEKFAPYDVGIFARMGMLLGEKPAETAADSNYDSGNAEFSTLPESVLPLGRWRDRGAA